jgi:hypothetical protein
LNAIAAPGQLNRYASRLMKNLGILIVLLLSFSTALAQSKRFGTFRFHTRKAGHTASVIFRVKSFTSGKPVYDPRVGVMVNGRKAHGAESTPEAEISSMVVSFDGRHVRIAPRLYSDCFDPNFRDNPLIIRFGRNFGTVRISMGGSDGAGGYEVTWVVRTNGHTTRSFFEP